jgi:hypothetical protein
MTPFSGRFWSTLQYLVATLCLAGCGGEYVDDNYWAMHTIDAELEGADGVDLFDIDADGDLDTLSAWEESGRVLLHENPGPLAVKQNWKRTDVSGGLPVAKIEDAEFADLDADGQIDAVVTATENRGEKVGIHWLVDTDAPHAAASWQGQWLDQRLRFLFVKIAIGQIDGEGALDIAVGSKSDSKPARLVWYRAPENPGPAHIRDWRGQQIADIEWTDTLQVIDVNADGRNDLLLNYRSHLAWYENPGQLERDDQLWPEHVISHSTGPYLAVCAKSPALRMVVGAELSAAEPGDAIAWLVSQQLNETGQWSGKWRQHAITSPDPIPRDPERQDYAVKSIACANIDTNPLPDVVMSVSGHGHGVFALMNLADTQGPQSLRLRTLASALQNSRKGIKHDDLRLADIDRDGDLDIVTTEENGNLENWWSSRGLGLIWYENPL